jgi:hypothetical protein
MLIMCMVLLRTSLRASSGWLGDSDVSTYTASFYIYSSVLGFTVFTHQSLRDCLKHSIIHVVFLKCLPAMHMDMTET